ncbi:MAG TPA: hypothetical protein VLW85_07615 [Myxococcales bacterium]|nr:hypothetical protein [Myxococcales bacterium]
MSESLYVFTICLFLGTIVLVFGMRFLSAFLQSRARLANDEAYRAIAQMSAAAQSETATSLSSIRASLADIDGRLASVERMLKEVQ